MSGKSRSFTPGLTRTLSPTLKRGVSDGFFLRGMTQNLVGTASRMGERGSEVGDAGQEDNELLVPGTHRDDPPAASEGVRGFRPLCHRRVYSQKVIDVISLIWNGLRENAEKTVLRIT